MHATETRGGDVGGETSRRGDGCENRGRGWIFDSVRGVHVAEDDHEVRHGRDVTQRSDDRSIIESIFSDCDRRSAREDVSDGRFVWIVEGGVEEATGGFEVRGDVGDVGGEEVSGVF